MMASPKMRQLKLRWIIPATAGLLLTAGLIAFFWGKHQTSRYERELVATYLPAMPGVEELPASFHRRLETVEARALSGPDRKDALLQLAALYHANGFLEEAMDVYDILLAIEPRHAKAAYRLGVLLAGYGQADDALPLFEIVMREAPDYLDAAMQKADILSKTNRPDEALALYREVLTVAPGDVKALGGIARIAIQKEDWKQALETLEEAVVRHPDHGINWSIIATVYDRLGQSNKARDARWRAEQNTVTGELPDPWLDELMLHCYDDYRLRVAAFAYRPTQRADRVHAVRLLERALRMGGDVALTHRNLGQVHIELGNLAAAREHLERAASLAPEIADNWSYLIYVLREQQDEAALQRAIAEGLSRSPRSPSLLLEQGRWLAGQGNLEDALTAFLASRRERPEEIVGYVEAARIYFHLGRVEAGMAELERGLRVDPGDPVALTALAMFAIRNGDREAAIQWLHRCQAQPRVPREDLTELSHLFASVFGYPPELR